MADLDIGKEIARMLQEYTDDVLDRIAKEGDKIAKAGAAELRRTSPVDTGEYAAGWTKRRIDGTEYIYNAKKPTLTHLLEFGHLKRGGGRVAGIPHIKPVEEKVIEDFEKAVIEAIERGG